MQGMSRFFSICHVIVAALLLNACGSESRAPGDFSTFKLPADLAALTSTRMIDRDELFAEIILRYADVEETIIATRAPGTDNWQADFRLPGGRDYSIELTWYDTVDVNRLDLVTFNRNFSGLFESGPITFDFSDYDFDGFDADNDGFVNLVERQDGTSPLVAEGTNVAVLLCIGGVTVEADSVCPEDAMAELELGFSQLSLSATPNETVSNNMLISNVGTAPLNYNAFSNQPWLRLVDDTSGSGVTGSLNPTESISLALQASCSDSIAVRNGSISVESDGGSDILLVALDCRGAILEVSPDFYQFAAEILPGTQQSAIETMTISNAGNELLDLQITSDSDWLCAVDPDTGDCAPSDFSTSVAPGEMLQLPIEGVCVNAPQMLAGNLTVTSNGGIRNFPATISCTLAPFPELSLLPGQFNLGSMQTQSSSGDLTISNPGTATLDYRISSDRDWLVVSSDQGAIQAGESAAVSLQAQCGEAVEVLSGSLLVSSNAGDVSVPVTLECAALPVPMLLLQTAPVSLSANFSQTSAGNFELTNTGSAELQYTISSDRDWLQLSNTQGALVAGDSRLLPFQASCDMTQESRTGAIQINSNGGSATLLVTLECTPLPQPQLELQTNELSLSALQNATATGSVAFSNTGTAPLTYTLGTDSGWIQLSGAEGTLVGGSNAAVPVGASCDSIAETRNGTINLVSNAGSASIAVVLTCDEIPQPVLFVETIEVALSAEVNQQAASNVTISNTGSADLQFEVTSDSAWLQLVSSNGNLAAGANTTFAFTASCNDMVERRSGSLSITSNGGGATVPVGLDCSALPVPELQIFGSPLALAAQQDATATGSFGVRNIGSALLNYQLVSDSGWLETSANQGALAEGAETTISVVGRCDGLIDTRVGSVSVNSDGGTIAIPVTLECSAAPVAMLSVQDDALSLQALLGESAVSNISISNTGNAELDFTATSNEPWLIPAIDRGVLLAGESTLLPLSASCDTEVLIRTGEITVDSNGGTIAIPVTLVCNALPQAALIVATESLSLQALQGDLATSDFSISNTGNAPLDYTASSNSAWLDIMNAMGTVDSGERAVIAVNAQCGDLVETRTANIAIDSNGGSADIPVVLDCTAIPVAVLDVRTTQLALTASIGQTADGVIDIQNSGTATLSYTIASEGSWLEVDAANTGEMLELIAGESRQVRVLGNCDSEIEALSGSVNFTSTAGNASVPVSLDCQGAILRVEPASLQLASEGSASIGGSAQDSIAIFNDGNAALDFTITSDSSWLCPDDPGSGDCSSGVQSFGESVQAGAFYSLPIAAMCSTVEETLSGAFNIESNGGSATIPVSLACTIAGAPALALTPLEFVEALDINVSGSDLLTLENTGSAPLNYDISSVASWLAVPANAGTLEAGESASVEVQYFCEETVEVLDGELLVSWDLGTATVPFSLSCMGPPNDDSGSRISGTVRDAVNDAPLQGVQVDLFFEDSIVAQSITDENGNFNFTGLAVQQGFSITMTFSGYISEDYAAIDTVEDGVTFLQTVLQVDEQFSGTGTISGTIRDAVSGLGVDGLDIDFRRGINTRFGEILNSVTTDNNGLYTVSGLSAGNYTAEITGASYQTAFFNAIVLGGQENNNQNASVSPLVLSGETRIVLSWGENPFDLDSHLTGPLEASSDRFHIYFGQLGSASASPFAFLDVDDTFSFGPETITINQQGAGVYRYSVHDFSNSSATSGSALAQSNARVQVLRDDGLIAEFNVPNQPGTLWTVFELEGNQVTPINSLSFESNPANDNAFKLHNDDSGLIRQIPAK